MSDSFHLKSFVFLEGLSGFYSEMMRGIGASAKMWEILDREPAVLLDSKSIRAILEYSIVLAADRRHN